MKNYIYLDGSKELQIGKVKTDYLNIEVECTKEQFEQLLDNPVEIYKRYFIDVNNLIQYNAKEVLDILQDKDEGMDLDINMIDDGK